MTGLSLLTLNIANPSVERAERQVAWLAERPEDVLVLTETKASQGCRLLAEAFEGAGYTVFDSKPEPGEYGVMIISKVSAEADDFASRLDYLPARAASCMLATPQEPIRVVGAYVPSRDASSDKTERKRRWLATFSTALDTCQGATLLLGDLNVLEPDHQPAYRFFVSFEYDFYRSLIDRHGMIDAFRHRNGNLIQHSWVGRTGDGYRYDHAFCTAHLRAQIRDCAYEHDVRINKLSDHSAMTITFDLAPPQTLDVTNPAGPQEATLF